MNRKNWKKTLEGRIVYENDANDYFFEWVEFENGEKSMLDLFQEVFGIDCGVSKDVKVKMGKGILFFEEVKKGR